MSTLGDILQLLPDVGRMRLAYNPGFWVRTANTLLSMIEAEARGPELYVEAFVPFNGRQTMFQVPAGIRKLLRVRLPDENGIMDQGVARSEIPYRSRGDGMIQLLTPPEIAPTTFTASQAITSSTHVRTDLSLPVNDLVGEGWAAIITHSTSDGSVEYRRVLSHEEGSSIVALDGPTRTPIAAGDSTLLVDLFMVFEGQKRLSRFTSEESSSPLPEEWDRILEAGLRWKMEVQSDEEGASQASQQWLGQFREGIEAFAGDLAERPGDQNRTVPRGGSHWSILL